jgi:hypothetical protein
MVDNERTQSCFARLARTLRDRFVSDRDARPGSAWFLAVAPSVLVNAVSLCFHLRRDRFPREPPQGAVLPTRTVILLLRGCLSYTHFYFYDTSQTCETSDQPRYT